MTCQFPLTLWQVQIQPLCVSQCYLPFRLMWVWDQCKRYGPSRSPTPHASQESTLPPPGCPATHSTQRTQIPGFKRDYLHGTKWFCNRNMWYGNYEPVFFLVVEENLSCPSLYFIFIPNIPLTQSTFWRYSGNIPLKSRLMLSAFGKFGMGLDQ